MNETAHIVKEFLMDEALWDDDLPNKVTTMLAECVSELIRLDEKLASFERQTVWNKSGDVITLAGFEEALMGIAEQYGRPPVAVYDTGKVLDKLEEDGMGEEEAVEFFQNVLLRSDLGELTPAFVELSETCEFDYGD